MAFTAVIKDDITDRLGRRRVWIEYISDVTGKKHTGGVVIMEPGIDAQAYADAQAIKVENNVKRGERRSVVVKVLEKGMDYNYINYGGEVTNDEIDGELLNEIIDLYENRAIGDNTTKLLNGRDFFSSKLSTDISRLTGKQTSEIDVIKTDIDLIYNIIRGS